MRRTKDNSRAYDHSNDFGGDSYSRVSDVFSDEGSQTKPSSRIDKAFNDVLGKLQKIAKLPAVIKYSDTRGGDNTAEFISDVEDLNDLSEGERFGWLSNMHQQIDAWLETLEVDNTARIIGKNESPALKLLERLKNRLEKSYPAQKINELKEEDDVELDNWRRAKRRRQVAVEKEIAAREKKESESGHQAMLLDRALSGLNDATQKLSDAEQRLTDVTYSLEESNKTIGAFTGLVTDMMTRHNALRDRPEEFGREFGTRFVPAIQNITNSEAAASEARVFAHLSQRSQHCVKCIVRYMESHSQYHQTVMDALMALLLNDGKKTSKIMVKYWKDSAFPKELTDRTTKMASKSDEHPGGDRVARLQAFYAETGKFLPDVTEAGLKQALRSVGIDVEGAISLGGISP